MFRERVDDYPDQEIASILRQTPKELRDLFNVVNTQLDVSMNLTERKALHYTDSDYSEQGEESICSTTTRHIYPRQALRENSLVYVANNDHYKQVIKAEVCLDPSGECRYLRNSLPYGLISSCQQKFAFKKLLYLDELEKRMTSDLFRYPSCCSCVIKPSSALFADGLRSAAEQKSNHSSSSSSSSSAALVGSTDESAGPAKQLAANTPPQSVGDIILLDADQRSPETRESRSKKEEEPISTRDAPDQQDRILSTTSNNKSSSVSRRKLILKPAAGGAPSSGSSGGGTVIVHQNSTVYTSSNPDSR